MDAAILEWAISEHLVAIMAPMFAMGPAWTVMRVISSYISDTAMAEETRLIRDSAKRQEAVEDLRRTREQGTERILETFDLWAGDIDFERDLREAIERVVKTYEKRQRNGARRRGKASVTRSVGDPELVRDAAGIVDGMARKG